MVSLFVTLSFFLLKTFFSLLRRWQWAVLSALVLTTVSGYFLLQRTPNLLSPIELTEEEGEEEEHDRPDRPDLAMLQEFNRTRDPATGTVPRERLVVAQARAEQLLMQQAQRTSASTLSSASWTE